jgi:CheW-like domain
MSTLEDLEAPPRPTRHWCLFQGSRRAYAVGLESVAEVVELERLVRLPHSPPRVLGLCTLRREVLPVIGLDRDDGASPEPTGMRPVLILRTSRGTWAVQVAGEGTAVGEGALEGPCPPPEPRAPWLTFLGTVRRGETVYAVIDPETTWKHVREGVETHYAGLWTDATEARHGTAAPTPDAVTTARGGP